jgi:N-acetylmuramoyl-L-alanine amidase
MKRAILLCLLLIFAACATDSRSLHYAGQSGDYLLIENFCKRHNLEYNFDTLDDIIKIFSRGNDIRLIFNSNVGYFNGAIFEMKNAPLYSNGRIFVPQDLEKIVFSKEAVYFGPAFGIKTVVIDPGHGGKDSGAISCRGVAEKDLNLKIAKYLQEELQSREFNAILTRQKDVFISLRGRVEFAKRKNADLFVSIHGNSNRSHNMRGTEVYYLSPVRFNSEERAADLAKEERLCPRSIPRDAQTILWDLVLTKNYGLSVELSNSLYFSFKNLGFKVKPPKKAPFYVLRLAYVPSVLVETGYLSNRYEEKWLRNDSYQRQIAEAIALGIVSTNKQYNSFENNRAMAKK